MSAVPKEVAALAPPGAGIPAFERLVGGAILAVKRRLGTTAAISTAFERQRAAIVDLYRGLDDEALRTRVLIPRLRGLEDSSRYWSIAMTLDHLRIVNGHMARVIESLVRGSVPHGRASTAAVKPSPEVGGEVASQYEASCDAVLGVVASSPHLRTPLRYAHPWFGPLDAAGWHVMSATHMGIHRAQIARIAATLKR